MHSKSLRLAEKPEFDKDVLIALLKACSRTSLSGGNIVMELNAPRNEKVLSQLPQNYGGIFPNLQKGGYLGNMLKFALSEQLLTVQNLPRATATSYLSYSLQPLYKYKTTAKGLECIAKPEGIKAPQVIKGYLEID